jgi:hypothetical protein
MIGYCHYLEATCGAIGLQPQHIMNVQGLRKAVEEILGIYGNKLVNEDLFRQSLL